MTIFNAKLILQTNVQFKRSMNIKGSSLSIRKLQCLHSVNIPEAHC